MMQVCIQSGKERRSLLHQSHSCVTPTMDTPFMSLGTAEEAFKIKVVDGPIDDVVADEKPRGEGEHRRCHLAADGIEIVVELSCQSEEGTFAAFFSAVRRIEPCGDSSHVLEAGMQLLLLLLHRGESSIDAGGESFQPRRGGESFFCCPGCA